MHKKSVNTEFPDTCVSYLTDCKYLQETIFTNTGQKNTLFGSFFTQYWQVT